MSDTPTPRLDRGRRASLLIVDDPQAPAARPTWAEQLREWRNSKAGRKHAGRVAQVQGAALEARAFQHFTAMGWVLQPIATPKAIVGGRLIRTKKVVGDIMGCTDTGRAVLIECKRRKGRNADEDPTSICRPPVPSDFEDHQRDVLLRWWAKGGLALIVWLSENGRDLRTSSPLDVFGPNAALIAEAKARPRPPAP